MKISFSKRMLSVFLSALMIVSSFTAIPFVAKADDTTGTLNLVSSAVVMNYGTSSSPNSNRYASTANNANGYTYNIVNDGGADNVTAAFWKYDLSSIGDDVIFTSASLSAAISNVHSNGNSNGNLNVKLYYINPANAVTSSGDDLFSTNTHRRGYVETALNTNTSTNDYTSTEGAGGTVRVNKLMNKYGLSDANLLADFARPTSATTVDVSKNLVAALNSAKDWDGLCIVAMYDKVNSMHASNANAWSDIWMGLNSTISYSASAETDPNVIAIDKVIAQYKTKMASMNGYVYTNMTDAYNTYVKALKLRKAVKFGGVVPQSANLTSLQDEMTANLNKMVQYTKPTISTSFSVGSYSIADAYKKNLLSMPDIYNFSNNTNTVGNHVYNAVALSSFTWLYDGETTMTAPVNIFFKNGTSDNNRFIYGTYMNGTTNGVTLGNGNWAAINTNSSGLSITAASQLQIYLLGSSLSTQAFPSSQVSSSTFSSTLFNNMTKVGMTGGDWHPASNYLSLAPASVPSSAKTNFVNTLTFTPSFNGQWTDSRKNGPWTCTVSVSAPITIVNYAKVRDEYLLKYLSKLNEITTYNTDQALALVKAYDALTSLNYVSNYSNASSLCATLKSAADAMSTTVLSNYSTLENAYTSASSLLDDTSNYTSTSVSDLTKLVNAVKSHFESLNPYGTSSALNTTSQVTVAATVLNTYASKILNEKIDTTALTAKYVSNNLNLTTNLPFNSDGSQRYTLSSWLDAYNKNEAAKSLEQEAATKGKYETQSDSASIFGTSYSFNFVTSTETGCQAKVDAKLAELNAVNLLDELKATDVSVLANYNSAKYVFDAVDTNKFNTEGLNHYNTIKTKDYDINVMATTDVISAYLTAINSTDSISSAIDTSTVDLDAHTAAMLEVAATNDLSYINQYNAYLTKVVDNVADNEYSHIADNVAYGKQISFNTNATDDSTVTYYVALYNKGDAAKVVANSGESIEPISVSRVSNFTSASLTKIANSDMIVTAYINTKQAASDSYTVKIYNGFGNVQQVEYVNDASTVTSDGATLTVGDKTVTINSYPFYTLTGWTITKYDSSKTVVARPQYSASKTDVKFVVNGGTANGTGYNAETNTAAVNKTVTLTSTTNGFYAWVRVNNGKYEVVSYNSEAKVIPVADSEYHVMVKSGDNYIVDGTAVTATNLAGFDSIGGNVTVNQLLGAKVPFTYIDTTSNVTNSKGESGYKYYVTVTTGASVPYKSFGIAAINDNGNTYYAASNIGATNQYSYAIKATTIGSAKVGAYLTYTVDINGKSVDIRIISTNA